MSPDGSRVVTTVAELNAQAHRIRHRGLGARPRGAAAGPTADPRRQGRIGAGVHRRRGLLVRRGAPDRGRRQAARGAVEAACRGRRGRRGGSRCPAGSNPCRRPATRREPWSRAPLLPSAATIDDDRRLRKLRKDNKITAILHTGYPVRYWDKDLGPGQTHLFGLDRWTVPRRPDPPQPGRSAARSRLRRQPGRPFVVPSWQVARAGRVAALGAGAHRPDHRRPHGDRRRTATPTWSSPAISPDGAAVAFTRESVLHTCARTANHVVPLALRWGSERSVAADWDRWPASVTWARDGAALLVTADDSGRCPIFGSESSTAMVRQLTADDFTLHRRLGRARRHRLRAAELIRGAAAPGAHRSGRHRHAHCPASSCRRCPATLTEITATADRRHRGAVLAGAAARHRSTRAAAAVDSRRTAGQLERLVAGGGIRG